MILELRQFLINADMHIIIKTIIQVIPKFSNLPCLHSISSIHFESNPFFTNGTHALRIMLAVPLEGLKIWGYTKKLVDISRENILRLYFCIKLHILPIYP